jgi:hypothetical protein
MDLNADCALTTAGDVQQRDFCSSPRIFAMSSDRTKGEEIKGDGL